MTYRIKSAAALTGISAATLRAWERRYGLVTPRRTEGGYRTYSETDLERLRRVKSLVDLGYKVSEAIALLEREAVFPAPLAVPSSARIRASLLDALLDLDRARAVEIARDLPRLPIAEQMEEVLLPVLREVGTRWARGEATIVQEHFASAFARERLLRLLEVLLAERSEGEEAVCIGVPGELHELGLLAAAVHLALRGWRVVYLGPDVPFAALGPTLHERHPALVCTSLIRSIPEAECVALAERLREIAPAGTRVLIGGAGVPESLVGAPLPGVLLTRGFPETLDTAA